MKITLLSEESLRLEPGPEMLTIEAPTAEQPYSPFHMVASGLALCTMSILQSWATNAKIKTDDLRVDVAWSFLDRPHRVGEYRVLLTWPSLPDARRATAERVAGLCPVKLTLQNPPTFVTEIAGGPAALPEASVAATPAEAAPVAAAPAEAAPVAAAPVAAALPEAASRGAAREHAGAP
ncbi:MAG TPA: OsmC family protein [Polyangiaceae bacterium]|nr:OsmC family protein [Polyangiaceae bacterium]